MVFELNIELFPHLIFPHHNSLSICSCQVDNMHLRHIDDPHTETCDRIDIGGSFLHSISLEIFCLADRLEIFDMLATLVVDNHSQGTRWAIDNCDAFEVVGGWHSFHMRIS